MSWLISYEQHAHTVIILVFFYHSGKQEGTVAAFLSNIGYSKSVSRNTDKLNLKDLCTWQPRRHRRRRACAI